ncbi:MAG: transglycosylase SLT domain-containing protein [Kiloniellales bacterium]
MCQAPSTGAILVRSSVPRSSEGSCRYGPGDPPVVGALALAPTARPGLAEPFAAVERRIDRRQPFISDAAARFDFPKARVCAVMQAESGGRGTFPDRPITSCAGAMELMQVMPETYEEMHVEHGLGDDLHDARDSIFAGTA